MKALVASLLLAPSLLFASPWLARQGMLKFHSSTPMEDIDAVSNQAVSTLDLDSLKIVIKARNTTFTFPNALMQEHFNENYMESETYPVSSFTGRFTEFDRAALDSGRAILATVDGILEVHGVQRRYTVTAALRRQADGSIVGEARFPVRVADHKIKVPAVVGAKIAESMDVTARFTWRAPEARP